MIHIKTPNNNIHERKYIIDIIFNEFLGLEYKLEVGSKDYEIILNNGKKITIEDTFFNKYPKDLEYLKLENIPKDINDLDIFAASFFMLTRWEEYVNKNRDKHNRFPATESLAYKQGFLDRPIVNEYLEELKLKLLKIDDSLIFKERKFELILTHDVDHIYKWDKFSKFIRHIIGDIVIRKSIIECFKSLKYYLDVKLKNKNDPYDTFDYLMDISDKLKIKSFFFFMARGITKYDNRYKSNSKDVHKLIDKIKNRGHYIGIHPTYNAYNDFKQFKNEKEELSLNFGTNIITGREHYLRFEVPNTWQIWEDNNMKWDSTCGYSDKEGFRCGVCYEYSVFNILSRTKLTLKEKPLIVMDGTLKMQKNMTPLLMKDKIKELMDTVKKYNGDFVYLWHNSSFNVKEWKSYNKVFEESLFDN